MARATNQPVVQPEVSQSKKPFIPEKTDAVVGFLDIETAPALGFTWGKWEQNVIDFVHTGYMLSYTFKRAGQRGVKTRGLPDYETTWEGDRDISDGRKRDDSELIKDLWRDLNSIDIIVAHNGTKFDLPWFATECLKHHLLPPKPSQIVDTLTSVRK